MDSSSEKVLFNLVNTKRTELDGRLQKASNTDRTNIIYLIYAESNNRSLPISLYVGKTSVGLVKRYRQHASEIKRCLYGKRLWNIKYRWMYEIIKSGSDLRVIELLKVPKNKVYLIEQEFIRYFENNGFNLINRTNDKFYSNKIYEVW